MQVCKRVLCKVVMLETLDRISMHRGEPRFKGDMTGLDSSMKCCYFDKRF